MKKGITWIEGFFSNQKQEHRDSFLKFIFKVTIFALLGAILGGLLDKLMNWIQGTRDEWYECLGFLTLQLLITSLFFFIVLRYIIVRPEPFDDWMINTFAGILFTITYFASQSTLSKNADCSMP